MLVVEVARGGRNLYGHKMRGWKVMTGGIPVARMNRAKDARHFAKNLRKLFARSTCDSAAAAALLASGQMQSDNDSWDDSQYNDEYERDLEEEIEKGIA